MSRREVRVTDQFFERLDAILPSERSDEGGPSTVDFLLHEMPTVIDRLASAFETESMPAVPGSEVRVLITSGVFGRILAFYATLAEDGWIEIIYLDID